MIPRKTEQPLYKQWTRQLKRCNRISADHQIFANPSAEQAHPSEQFNPGTSRGSTRARPPCQGGDWCPTAQHGQIPLSVLLYVEEKLQRLDTSSKLQWSYFCLTPMELNISSMSNLNGN